MKKAMLICAVAAALPGCADENAKPVYGPNSGLPANCRAYVQVTIDGIRDKKFSVDDALNGLERNCGKHGILWGQG